jgi:hypothetical protein
LDVGVLTVEKEHMGFIKGKLKDRIAKGFDRVQLFGTILSRRVIPLAKRMTKMWEYYSHTDPDRVSPEAVPDDDYGRGSRWSSRWGSSGLSAVRQPSTRGTLQTW